MFFNNPGKPTVFKKIIYLAAAIILGILLSIIAHTLIEIVYLRWAESHNLAVNFTNGCAFWPAFNYALFLAGAIGGFFLGRFWWRLVYVERFWEKKVK